MSLPPGFLEELRTRTSLSQVVGRKVMWDTRRSNQGKGDMWAPCPFHQEKTASFHVDDRKGFYYCFGCHAKGDAISFVRETENVGFMEAVEILAREAGMPVPKRDPKAQEKADRRSLLAEVMEQAVQFYRLQLKTTAASGARDYLAGRDLSGPALEKWEIGYAPDTRQTLWSNLTGKGIAPDLVVEAGLAVQPEDGGAPFDRFRGRIIFPIRDAQGRAIALGGRAMSPNARAKYLNSPETPLFDKGRSLYNHGPAREAAGKGNPLVVAEGYMDVIAMVEAGFPATVAPLGTAITESQLQMLWRIAPEPVIALDGDAAGNSAAYRLIALALPRIEAGQSLRFARMPDDEDPDDVIRKHGAAAMRAILDGAKPMVQLLWQQETEGQIFDSPERRAALDKSLRRCLQSIKDPSLRTHYAQEINRLRKNLFDGGRKTGRGGFRRFQPPPIQASTKNSLLVAAGGGVEDHLREAVILATLISTPAVMADFEPALEKLEMSTPDHQRMLETILSADTPEDPRVRVEAQLGGTALEKLFALRHVQIAPSVRAAGNTEIAALCLAEELAKLSAKKGAEREILEAMEDMSGLADEGLTWRLSQAAEARNRAERSETEDKTTYDTGPNGAKLNREERHAFEQLLEKITYAKGRQRPH